MSVSGARVVSLGGREQSSRQGDTGCQNSCEIASYAQAGYIKSRVMEKVVSDVRLGKSAIDSSTSLKSAINKVIGSIR